MSHFYEKLSDGEILPRHYIEKANSDYLRPTTIRDVRKWWDEGREVVPSVTTILNMISKPQLENWKIDQHLAVALDLAYNEISPGLPAIEEDWWIKEVKRLTAIEMDKAPNKGTDFHKLMEQFLESPLSVPDEHRPLCDGVFGLIEEHTECDGELCSSEVNFVSDGYGGQIDLITAPGQPWIIDYKTKQTADKFKPGKMAYEDHSMQLAAYRKAVAPDARCANVFVCLEDGQVDFHEHTEEQLQKGWRMFQACLTLWQEKYL